MSGCCRTAEGGYEKLRMKTVAGGAMRCTFTRTACRIPITVPVEFDAPRP